MDTVEILRPPLVLAGWTIVMAIWLVATRVPAMSRARIDPQKAQNTSRLNELLPHEAQRIAHNYNHLFEQPTLFYAVTVIIAVLGHVDTIHTGCAWAFVALRIAHSCVQATIDLVMARFSLFLMSWLALAIMILRELAAVF